MGLLTNDLFRQLDSIHFIRKSILVKIKVILSRRCRRVQLQYKKLSYRRERALQLFAIAV